MPVKKIDKEFVLSDSSVNQYGFRLMTNGYDMGEFMKNPIGYYGHDKKDGVLIRWEDIRLEDDKVLGKPVINMLHPRADRTVEEVENGFLNSASVGRLRFLEYHLEDNPEDEENPIVTVTKWYNKECSLVDNPSNRNAMKVELCDENDDEINLSDFIQSTKQKIDKMKKIELPINAKTLSLLNLSDKDTITADDVLKGIEDLHDENVQLTTDKKKAEEDLAAEKKTSVEKRIKNILDKGLADGKFTKETRVKLEKGYATLPDDLEDLVNGMQPFQSVVEALNQDGKKPEGRLGELLKKSYKELDLADELEELKTLNEEEYGKKLNEFKASRNKKKA